MLLDQGFELIGVGVGFAQCGIVTVSKGAGAPAARSHCSHVRGRAMSMCVGRHLLVTVVVDEQGLFPGDAVDFDHDCKLRVAATVRRALLMSRC